MHEPGNETLPIGGVVDELEENQKEAKKVLSVLTRPLDCLWSGSPGFFQKRSALRFWQGFN